MKPTEILMEEHRVIERVLFALERASSRLNRGEDVYLRFFIGTSVFIRDFADNSHHRKEEAILFPALTDNGFPKDSGPIAVMLAEHEEGRKLTQKIRLVTERLQGGDLNARQLVSQYGTEYVKLLRRHINKENEILFPMADKVIPADQQDQILEAFELFQPDGQGEEFREKYYGMANRLIQESVRQK
jgi:hemerythrin-like domain-containing protein